MLRPLALFGERYLDRKQKQKCHALKNNSFYFYVKAFHPSPQVLNITEDKRHIYW